MNRCNSLFFAFFILHGHSSVASPSSTMICVTLSFFFTFVLQVWIIFLFFKFGFFYMVGNLDGLVTCTISMLLEFGKPTNKPKKGGELFQHLVPFTVVNTYPDSDLIACYKNS